MNSVLCDAIRDRRIVELRYHGYSRVVEPYTHGRGADGDGLLRCYQLRGGSASGERSGWKLLKLAEVFALEPSDEHFAVRPDYRRGDSAMAFIHCQL
jgi:hypothetical protein